MPDWTVYLPGLVITLLLLLATWITSIFKRDVSIVDSTWSVSYTHLTLPTTKALCCWGGGAGGL